MAQNKRLNLNKIFPLVFAFFLALGMGIYTLSGTGGSGQTTIDDLDEDAEIKEYMGEDSKPSNPAKEKDPEAEELDPVEGLKKGPQTETHIEKVDEDKDPEVQQEEKKLDQDEVNQRLLDMVPEIKFDFEPDIEIELGGERDKRSKIEDSDADVYNEDETTHGIEMPEKPEPPEMPEF